MNIEQALQYGRQQLQGEEAATDAGNLLCYVLGCNSARLMTWPQQDLSNSESQQFIDLIQHRKQGVPIAYLTGEREFWSMKLQVSPATLIPRPDTETLVESILERHPDSEKLSLLDLGTGSGAIALAIASERPHWQITATDLSHEALAIAHKNADRHKLTNISFVQGNWFQAVKTNFHIIVSNPPYIASNDGHLTQGDVRFEPETALVSGISGMDDIEHLSQHAPQYLKANGWLYMEHGYNQSTAVQLCLQKNGFCHIVQKKDLAGHIRVSGGQWCLTDETARQEAIQSL